MPGGWSNMDNKAGDQLFVVQYIIDENKEPSDEKMDKYSYKSDKITAMIKIWWIRIKNRIPWQTRWVHQSPSILTLQS